MTITSDRDKLRLALGDRDSTNYIFNNDELDSFLSDETTVLSATLAAARSAEMYFARAYDIATDGQSFNRSQMAAAFAKIVKRLEAAGVKTSTNREGVTTLAATKIDGYTQDIDNQQVHTGGSAVNNRQTYYVIGDLDRL